MSIYKEKFHLRNENDLGYDCYVVSSLDGNREVITDLSSYIGSKVCLTVLGGSQICGKILKTYCNNDGVLLSNTYWQMPLQIPYCEILGVRLEPEYEEKYKDLNSYYDVRRILENNLMTGKVVSVSLYGSRDILNARVEAVDLTRDVVRFNVPFISKHNRRMLEIETGHIQSISIWEYGLSDNPWIYSAVKRVKSVIDSEDFREGILFTEFDPTSGAYVGGSKKDDGIVCYIAFVMKDGDDYAYHAPKDYGYYAAGITIKDNSLKEDIEKLACVWYGTLCCRGFYDLNMYI